MAVDRGALSVRSPIKIRLTNQRPPRDLEAELFPDGWNRGDSWLLDTTLGRVLFNELLPVDYPFVNEQMPKKRQAVIINDLAERYPMIVVAQTVDKLKLVNAEGGELTKNEAGLIVARSGEDLQADPTVRLRDRHLEGSNVSAVEEMVATMSLNRSFEMQMKVFKASDSMTESGNRLLGA